ncbi:MAG: hypothetical protein J0L77_08060 [Alphaproteobacteria bacterium]|nr:hypothetical protein [Alphaproteobacteria bacterium]
MPDQKRQGTATSPGYYRALTPTREDYNVFRAGYRFFQTEETLKDAFEQKPFDITPPSLRTSSQSQSKWASALDDENQFRQLAPSLYVVFEEMTVHDHVAQDMEDEQLEIRKLRQEMEALRLQGDAWKTKDKALKQKMEQFGVGVFLDLNQEPEYVHCLERVRELEKDLSTLAKGTQKKRTLKVFRLVTAPPGSSSRGMKVKIADASQGVTTSDKAMFAKMAPVPHP